VGAAANANSGLSGQKGRASIGVTRAKNFDSKGNSRMANMNSPLLQLPPQILQSKIIINLWRTEYPLIEEVAKEVMGWRVSKNENPMSEFDIFWQDLGIDSERLSSLKLYQKVNHFPAMYLITRKTFLARNLKRLQKLFPLEYDFFPRTWVLPNEMNDLRTYAEKAARRLRKKILENAKQLQQNQAQNSNTKTANDDVTKLASYRSSRVEPTITLGDPDKMYGDVHHTTPKIDKRDLLGNKKSKSKVDDEDGSGDDYDRKRGDDDSASEASEDDNKNSATKATTKAQLPKLPRRKYRINFIVKPDCMSQGKGIFLTNDIENLSC
jgi:hypothetical protein